MSHTMLQRTAASVPNPPSGHATVFVDEGVVKVKISTGTVFTVGPAEESGGSTELAWSAAEAASDPTTLVVGEIQRFEAGAVASFIFPLGAEHGDRVGLFCTDGGGSNNANLYVGLGECFEDYETRALCFDQISVVSPSSTHLRASSFYLEYRYDATSYDTPTWRLVNKDFVMPSKGMVILNGANGAIQSASGDILFSAARTGVGVYLFALQNLPPNSNANGLAVAIGLGNPGSARSATYEITNGGGAQYALVVHTWNTAGAAADVDILSVSITT